MKTVQKLVRHANSSVTLNLYAQAVTDIKRTAQSKVARLVFAEKAVTDDWKPYWTFLDRRRFPAMSAKLLN